MATQTLDRKKFKPVSLFSDNQFDDDPILIKSPLNYIGGKFKILKQIIPLFPTEINNFVDLFAGGCNVGINVKANTIYFNDNLTFLVDMFKEFKAKEIDETTDHIYNRIDQLGLSQTNEEGYKELRDLYNAEKNPLDLFVLVAFSFNHQIRFNNSHKFNNPFGRNRSSFNDSMESNLKSFISRLKELNTVFSSTCFNKFDTSFLNGDDFVYCDPPYLITTGSYNDGKRGFKGWRKKEELLLLKKLDTLHKQGVKFALSNVIEHKGKSNNLLKEWLSSSEKYKIYHLNFNYSNSNYQTKIRDKNSSKEVLVTNY